MQPYFFPYIGYMQLMHAVDLFILYDDAQYMKGGWINRNKIRIGDRPVWVTLPVRHASYRLAINQREYCTNPDEVVHILEQLRTAYSKTHYFDEVWRLISPLFSRLQGNVASQNTEILKALAKALDIECRFVAASELSRKEQADAQGKVIELCRSVGATEYVNAIGGATLYTEARFQEAGLSLNFLKTEVPPTPLSAGSVHLSILDSMFACGLAGTRQQIPMYRLLDSSTARLESALM